MSCLPPGSLNLSIGKPAFSKVDEFSENSSTLENAYFPYTGLKLKAVLARSSRSSSSRRLAWKSPVSSIVSASLDSESPSTDIY